MSRYKFECPHCKQSYKITLYHPGYSDVIPVRCSKCSIHTDFDIYDGRVRELYKRGGQELFEEALASCECGGRFSEDAPYRCRVCNHAVSIEEMKAQTRAWFGAARLGRRIGREHVLPKQKKIS